MADTKRRPGRQTTFTDEVAEAILKRIELGTPPSVAAQACGVAPGTFKGWRDARPDFAEAVACARAEFESQSVTGITLAAADDWRAAAWNLERQIHARYALKIKAVREEEAGCLLKAAERVLSREDLLRLIEAIAAQDREGLAVEAEGGEPIE